MDVNHNSFQDRLRRIDHSGPREGSAVRMRPDGLVVSKRSRLKLSVPWRSVMLALVCCFLLKGLMIWHQGEADYAVRLTDLSNRSMGHQAAAWLLSMDPVSSWIGATLTEVLGRPPS